MNRLILGIAVSWMVAGGALADTYIKEVSKQATYSGEKRTSEKDMDVHEIWMAADKISYSTPRWILIVDLQAGKMILCSRKSKTFVETSLPAKAADILTKEACMALDKTTGTVRETGQTQELLGKESKCFEVVSLKQEGQTLSGEQRLKVWTTTDVPFSLKPHDAMLENLRIIYNRDDKYREELKKLSGLQMLVEMEVHKDGSTIKLIDEIVEISEQDPPAGVYVAPADFKKTEKLTKDLFE